MTITLGADPEIFLQDNNGKFISAINKIGGTKKNPLKINDTISVQEDNVLAEFNIAPINCNKLQGQRVWTSSILQGINEIRKKAADFQLGLSFQSSAIFTKDQLADRKANEFACDPDFNIYTNQINPKPRGVNPCLRSAGGHIHIGFPKDSGMTAKTIIPWLDLYVGLWGVLKDPLSQRTQLYGKAGSFRPKPYGLEYRTPSNFWLQSQEDINEMYQRVIKSISAASTTPLSRSTTECVIELINSETTTIPDLVNFNNTVYTFINV